MEQMGTIDQDITAARQAVEAAERQRDQLFAQTIEYWNSLTAAEFEAIEPDESGYGRSKRHILECKEWRDFWGHYYGLLRVLKREREALGPKGGLFVSRVKKHLVEVAEERLQLARRALFAYARDEQNKFTEEAADQVKLIQSGNTLRKTYVAAHVVSQEAEERRWGESSRAPRSFRRDEEALAVLIVEGLEESHRLSRALFAPYWFSGARSFTELQAKRPGLSEMQTQIIRDAMGTILGEEWTRELEQLRRTSQVAFAQLETTERAPFPEFLQL